MRTVFSGLLCAGLLTGFLLAQQPNTGVASMRVNGTNGPPYPITGVSLPRGLPQNIVISGAPVAPFILFGGPSLLASGQNVLGGQRLDVDISTASFILLDGTVNPAFSTDATGIYNQNIVLPATATIGSSAAFQTVIADPTNAPFNTSLTAASEVVVTQGLTVVTVSNPNNGGSLFDLNAYGLSFPFYSNTYTRMFVNSDGNITFNAASGDFTPTPAEFRTQNPRIAPMWTDFDPSFSPGQITVTVDQSSTAPFPTVTVDWVNMAEWSNVGARHTFNCVLNTVTGDITMNHDPFNVAMVYDQFMGISPGLGLLPPAPNNQWSAFKDLSTLPSSPILGLANESFWEWYGLVGMTFYTQGFNNPWDMTGTTTNFLAVGAGSTGGAYFGS